MKKIYFLIFILITHSVLVYSVEPNTVIATIPVGLNPAGIAVTPNNLFAYVANDNQNNIPGQDTVSVLNLTTNVVDQTISSTTFNQPYTITINASGTKAYVTNSNYTTVSIVDISANAVTGLITGFDGPSGFAITPDGATAYVNNYGSPEGVMSGNGTKVNIVDLTTLSITGTIIVDQAPAALALSPDGKHLYVASYTNGNLGAGTVDVVDTTSNLVTTTILGFSGPFAITVTPDGQYAYVTNFGSNNFSPVGTTISVIDLNTNNISDTITVGIQPDGLAITPDGRYAYATNYNTLYNGPCGDYTDLTAAQGTVNIIDIATNTVISPMIPVGRSPANVAISPDGQFAYITNYTSNTVDVIALPAAQITIQGCKIVNRFLTQIDYCNKLTWTVSGSSLPKSYSIYRDANLTDLAGTILAEPFIFFDHNRNPNSTYTYYIVGNYDGGITTVPLAITITQNC
ncbi:MAG: beta-propeller fold lactonase family protein [Candidatus Babeliaceae bacterium]|nr:beta-propeller fold lactonase family protein [Candidatus Babeliaceae bacterium]